MGHQLLEQLVEISPVERRMSAALAAETAEEGEQPEEPGVVRVSGFVSRPEVQKLNRNQIYFFVNRRLVRDRLILHAITEAYRNILPASVFPVALIFLELPASEVDVNVHPSKTEVRFRRAAFLHDLVRDSIRQALVAARPVAAFPMPKASRAPSPDLDEAEAAERISEEPPLLRGAEVRVPRSVPAAPRGTRDFQLSSPRPAPETGTLPLEGAALSVYEPPVPSPPTTVEREGEVAPAGSGVSEFPADLHPLGQVQDSFIVATNAEGLWIIDQHVAHERVLFERHLRQRREKKVEGQRLLLPIIVGLTPQQLAAFQDIAEELDANGFEVEPFGQRTVAVKTSPAEIRADEVERLLLEILESVGREAHGLSLDDLRLKIATSVACHAAIKVNMPLERKKMEWLLRELGKTECPMSCPHGRPIVLRYGLKEIEKAFKRT
jgi:DNA mismatch repair protein MutL